MISIHNLQRDNCQLEINLAMQHEIRVLISTISIIETSFMKSNYVKH